MTRVTGSAWLAVLWALLPALANGKALDADLGGVDTVYTHALLKILRASPPLNALEAAPGDSSPVRLKCWQTAGNDYYIGVEQELTIAAPLSRVQSVLDDVDHYKDIFRDFKEIRVESRNDNVLRVFWEQIVPVFFLPNVKYETLYLIDGSVPGQRIYRYQLAKRSDLKGSDGFVLIRKDGESRTRYLEYDFFDAEWGAAKVLGKEKIWKEAVDGIALSDLAVQWKSEHPEWPGEKIRSESERQWKSEWSERCFVGRSPFQSPSP